MLSGLLGWSLNLNIWLKLIVLIVFIVGGMVLLIKGADGFVSGASGVAKKLKIPAIIIGLTIVSIGTSLPEASVSLSSVLNGSSDISIGNIVGSNMFNLLVVLGFSLVFVPIILNRKVVIKDFLIMIISTLLLLIFAFVNIGGGNQTLSRIECGILFVLFIAYIVWSVIDARKNKTEEEKADETNKVNSMPKNILFLVLGLLGIVIGGDLVVFGAQNFAIQVGMSEVLVGLTIVAVGTSLPELVTSIIAAKKGEKDIALGNVIGSSTFNILFIIGLTGLVSPLAVSAKAMIDIIIVSVVFIAFFVYSLIKNKLPKYLGYIMIVMYIIYLTYIILRDFVLA